MQLIPNKSVQL